MSDLSPLIRPEDVEAAYRRFDEFVAINRNAGRIREATKTLCSYLGFDLETRRLFVDLSGTIADADRIDHNSYLLGGLIALLAADNATDLIPAEDEIEETIE